MLSLLLRPSVFQCRQARLASFISHSTYTKGSLPYCFQKIKLSMYTSRFFTALLGAFHGLACFRLPRPLLDLRKSITLSMAYYSRVILTMQAQFSSITLFCILAQIQACKLVHIDDTQIWRFLVLFVYRV